MEQAYWLESFTRRRFFPELETMPPDVVQQVTKQMQDLYLSTAQVMRRLHGERWHALCFYPRLEKDAPLVCPACQVQYDLEQLLLVKVYGHIGGVVIDFFHEPQHRDQLEAA